MIMTKFSPPAGRRCPPGRARTAAGGGADLSFVHIIWNPVAGNGAARAVFVRVRELLARAAAFASSTACPAYSLIASVKSAPLRARGTAG